MSFEEFMNVSTRENSPLDESRVKKRILRDLVKSPRQLGLYYLFVSGIGYWASLSVCSQNAFGLSDTAFSIADKIHVLPYIMCAIVCGTIFTAVPFFVSLLLLNRFQHRYLIFKMWWLVLLLPLVSTLSLRLVPIVFETESKFFQPDGMMMANSPWWLAAAIVTPYLLEGLTFLWLRGTKLVQRKA